MYKNQDNHKINIVVRRRDGLLFAGMVDAVTSVSDIGEFDVLPWHTNFVSEIKERILIHLPQGLKKEISINRGIMKVEKDMVEIYVGI